MMMSATRRPSNPSGWLGGRLRWGKVSARIPASPLAGAGSETVAASSLIDSSSRSGAASWIDCSATSSVVSSVIEGVSTASSDGSSSAASSSTSTTTGSATSVGRRLPKENLLRLTSVGLSSWAWTTTSSSSLSVGVSLASVGVSSSAIIAQSTSPAVINRMLPSWATRDMSFLNPEKPTFFSSNSG